MDCSKVTDRIIAFIKKYDAFRYLRQYQPNAGIPNVGSWPTAFRDAVQARQKELLQNKELVTKLIDFHVNMCLKPPTPFGIAKTVMAKCGEAAFLDTLMKK